MEERLWTPHCGRDHGLNTVEGFTIAREWRDRRLDARTRDHGLKMGQATVDRVRGRDSGPHMDERPWTVRSGEIED